MSDRALNQIAASRFFWSDRKARPEQLPEGTDWDIWLYLAGRGAGKTRSAAEWLAWKLVCSPDARGAVVAPTYSDARDTCIEGESGLRAILDRYEMKSYYNRSLGELGLKNGARVKLFSAEEPDRLRGPQHHFAWFDELAAADENAWDQLLFGLRLGTRPQVVVTTTPRPTRVIKSLVSQDGGRVRVVRGSTFDNAENLAPSFLESIRDKYEGTRLGRQELFAEILEDVPGALWTLDLIVIEAMLESQRTVVAVDPAVTNTEDSDETGIVVVSRGTDGLYYVREDYSCKDSPLGWAKRAVAAYHELQADRLVYEANQGGDVVADLIRQIDGNVALKAVSAKVGKRLRAEPIAALYEQGKVFHVKHLTRLEDQMVTWVADDPKSPDRLDALVHGLTELAGSSPTSRFLAEIATLCPQCRTPNTKGAKRCVKCAAELSDGVVEPQVTR